MRATVRSECDVIGFVTRTCFKTGPPGAVGIESEWFLHLATGLHRPGRRRLEQMAEAIRPLPKGSSLTFEPGGQLELSTACASDVSHAVARLRGDLAWVDTVLEQQGLHRVGLGLDAASRPQRVLDLPRYIAMEEYFDTSGRAGRVMMNRTAALQVCLDAGRDDEDVQRRWAITHALAPVLVAAFANSPLRDGRPSGWASSRQHVWAQLDPTRTSRVDTHPGEPAEQWAHYALDARVMLVRRDAADWLVDPGLTLREWVDGASDLPAPTFDDVAYHLSTLFPPVRPRAWLEVRVIDALPDTLWPVAVAVTSALVDDPVAADAARAATAATAGRGALAARVALRDPCLRRAAETCFSAALSALPRLGADTNLVSAVDTFADQFVGRGRCPADDLLDDWRRGNS
jgi:glutamate--cysteine ligase